VLKMQFTQRCFVGKDDLVTKLEAPASERARPNGFCLSVVVPCFNEEHVLLLTYHRLIEVLGAKDFRLQIVFVDDGSTDSTAEIVANLAKNDQRVNGLQLSRNFGHQAAISAGLAYADGDAVVIMDADLQDPPEVVIQMIEKWLDGAQVVYGVRTKRKEPFLKRTGYSLYYRAFQRLSNVDAPIDAGDFSLIDRKVLNVINELPEKNRFFRGLRAWSGFRQVGIEYERYARAAGSSKYPLRKLIGLAKDGIFSFSTVPLTGVFYLGLLMSSLAFAALLFVFLLRIFDIPIFGMRASDVQGFSTTILSVLLIGGIQLVSTGVLGEYIGRIYNETKNRPTYVIRNKIGTPGAVLLPLAKVERPEYPPRHLQA
jgi:glycosyltransferase involved in cell wall biosynthesis